MYYSKYKFNILALSFASAILFAGCGETGVNSSQNNSVNISEKNLRTSTYIYKGNFVEIASYAYKRVTDPSFTQDTMDVSLPGIKKGEVIKLSTYNINAIEDQDELKKIVVQNRLNRLEIKLLDDNRVSVLLQGSNFTIDRKMALADFIAKN